MSEMMEINRAACVVQDAVSWRSPTAPRVPTSLTQRHHRAVLPVSLDTRSRTTCPHAPVRHTVITTTTTATTTTTTTRAGLTIRGPYQRQAPFFIRVARIFSGRALFFHQKVDNIY